MVYFNSFIPFSSSAVPTVLNYPSISFPAHKVLMVYNGADFGGDGN